MRPLKIAFSVLALVLVLIPVLLILSPSTLIVPLGNQLLSEQNLSLSEVQRLSLGPTTLTIDSARIDQDGYEIFIEGLTAQYSVGGLVEGHLEKLTVQKLEVSALDSGNVASENSGFDSETLSQQMRELPIESIDIAAFEYSSSILNSVGSFSLDEGLFELYNTIQSPQFPELTMDADFTFSELSQIRGDLAISSSDVENANLLETSLLIAITNDAAEIQADIIANPAELLGYVSSINDLPLVSYASTQVNISSTAHLENLNALPSLVSASIEFNPNEEQLSLGFENYVIELLNTTSAPWSATLAVIEDDNYLIALPDSELEVHLSDPQEIAVNLDISDLEVNCSQIFACEASMQLNAELPEVNFDWIEFSGATVVGKIEIFSSASALRLRPTELSLEIISVATDGYSMSGSYLLRNVVASFSDELNLSTSIESSALDVNGESFSLVSPSLFGDVELDGDELLSSLILRLNNQVDIGLLVNHELVSGNGSMGLEFRAFQFSDSVSLSSLVDQSLITGDLVRGRVAGNAVLNWQADNDEALSFSGPVNLSLENLSGYINDSYFVGFGSEIASQFTSPLGLKSYGEQQALISTLDTGLPVEQLSWNFEFDTAASLYNITEFNSAVLGGNISIADFAYSPTQKSEVAIVLSELNLESIVALAEYPGVEVDGFISGYLPVQLSGNNITIEEGLVAALNPGGVIRYTPANPVASSNPSLQLVNDALSNYQYKTMNTEVHYGENGDLLMEVQLQGTNPDMNGGQPINLNVNITDNIPTLLRSLRASRVITDALESSLDSR